MTSRRVHVMHHGRTRERGGARGLCAQACVQWPACHLAERSFGWTARARHSRTPRTISTSPRSVFRALMRMGKPEPAACCACSQSQMCHCRTALLGWPLLAKCTVLHGCNACELGAFPTSGLLCKASLSSATASCLSSGRAPSAIRCRSVSTLWLSGRPAQHMLH